MVGGSSSSLSVLVFVGLSKLYITLPMPSEVMSFGDSRKKFLCRITKPGFAFLKFFFVLGNIFGLF